MRSWWDGEGGITAKAQLHGLEPAQPRSAIQSSSIPGPVLQNALIPEIFPNFPTLTMKERKNDIGWMNPRIWSASDICPLEIQSPATEKLLPSISHSDLILFHHYCKWFEKYLLFWMMKPMSHQNIWFAHWFYWINVTLTIFSLSLQPIQVITSLKISSEPL